MVVPLMRRARVGVSGKSSDGVQGDASNESVGYDRVPEVVPSPVGQTGGVAEPLELLFCGSIRPREWVAVDRVG